jgi:CO/xanthine dehydrogenase FAD-binding subunit
LAYEAPQERSPAIYPGGRFYRPSTLAEAVDMLAADPWTVVSGCTVYYLNPASRPDSDWILDVSGLPGLTRIDIDQDRVRIGAAATWSAIAHAPLPPACRVLQEAACSVGSVQIRNAGTIGGNLAGAASTADGVPPLLVLDAGIELSAAAGTRTVPIASFILGSRRTAKRPEELLSAVVIPLSVDEGNSRRQVSTYLKLAARSSQAPTTVSVAALIGLDAVGCIDTAAVAVGACSSMARRLPGLERRLIGIAPAATPLASVFDAEEDLALLSPVGDVRVTAAYRLDAAATLVRRALTRLEAEAGGPGSMRQMRDPP